MRGSKETKETKIIEEVRKIVTQHETDGITKNEIIRQLDENEITTRRTFYKYLKKKAFDNIFELHKIGKREICFPTEQNQALVKLKKDLKKVDNLLNLLENEPLIGDCFAINCHFRNFPLLRLRKEGAKNLNHRYDHHLFDSIETNKPSKEYFPMATIYSLTARQNIVKDLPSFLIHYINNPYKEYSEQVKDEFLKLIIPIVTRCLRILQRDYSESYSYSNSFKEKFSEHLPENKYANVSVTKGNTTPDLVLEFLKALGRYDFCFFLKQGLDKKHDSSKQREIISLFITTFYEPFLGKNISIDLKKKISKTKLVDQPVTQKLINHIIVNTDDKRIKDYYIQHFIELEMFSKEEKMILREKRKNV